MLINLVNEARNNVTRRCTIVTSDRQLTIVNTSAYQVVKIVVAISKVKSTTMVGK